MSSATPDREFVSTRLFSAPRDRVFQAWTDPARLARWWGPKGCSNTLHEFVPKPGGNWRFVMHGPDGKDYQNHYVFIEIAAPERIVLDHKAGPEFRVTAIFEDRGPSTKLTFRMLFESAEACADVAMFAAEANEQSFDRLGEELAR
ncbi:MAG: SRPBCC family protein [Gallionella sp.]|nr:SRPBCC family protein [Gallionella sp.]